MSDGQELLTVAVPCLNEEGNIANTVTDILAVVPKLPMSVEIVLIDDGSTDTTRERMLELSEEHAAIRVKVNDGNLGPGRSVLNLYDEIDERSWFTAIPGDNEIVFASLLNYVPMRKDHDIILGYLQNPVIRTATRRLASAAFTALARATYGFEYRYLNGPKLYRVEVFKGIDVVGGSHAFNAELLAKAILRRPGLRIGEAPFMARGRKMGETKAFRPRNIGRSVRDFFRGQRDVVRYRSDAIARGIAPSEGESEPSEE